MIDTTKCVPDLVWAAASKPGSIVSDEVSNYVRTFWEENGLSEIVGATWDSIALAIYGHMLSSNTSMTLSNWELRL